MHPSDLLLAWQVEAQPILSNPLDVDALVRQQRARANLRAATRSLSQAQARLAAVLIEAAP